MTMVTTNPLNKSQSRPRNQPLSGLQKCKHYYNTSFFARFYSTLITSDNFPDRIYTSNVGKGGVKNEPS